MTLLRRRWKWLALGTFSLSLLAAAVGWWFFDGPASEHGVYARYEADYRRRAVQLGRLAKATDAEPPVATDELRPRLDPMPVPYTAGRTQTCWFAVDWELRQPPRSYRDPKIRVAVDSDSSLVRMHRSYQRGDADRLSWRGPASGTYHESFVGGLAETYLLVTRLRDFEPAVEQPDGSLSGGAAEVEGFLYDLRSDERVGRLAVAVRLPPRSRLEPAARYLTDEGETPVEATARDWLGRAARNELRAKLVRLCGVKE